MGPELFRLHADREVRHWWFVGRRHILRRLVHELVPPGMDRTIVDVGCGTGANVAALASEYHAVGIDISADGIALARERFPDCRFIVGSAPDDLGDLASRADLFLLNDVLEHVRDDIALFTSLMAAAKPGAFAIITVPADPTLWSRHDVEHQHYRRYTPERLRMLWEGDPIEQLMVAQLNRRLLPAVRLVRSFERRSGRALGPRGTDLGMPPAPINAMLTRILAGEATDLVHRLRTRSTREPARAVSLLAVVRRREGRMTPRGRTQAMAAADLNDPEARP